MQPWTQIYTPLGSLWLSALAAAIPILFFFVALAVLRMKGHVAAAVTLALALAVAIFAYGMPAQQALAAAGFGFAYGLWPIAWIIVTAVFLYKIVVKTGQFDVIRASVLSITDDQRLQMLLIGFAFGAFLEGAAGFGAPVAITAALLVGLGFNPLYAAGLCLIANTAPVAFGAMGIPIIVAGQVTGIDPMHIGAMAGRQLPLLSLAVPFWLVFMMDGAGRARDLAGRAGRRWQLRRHAVLHVEPHRARAAGHHVGAGQPDLARRVPACVATALGIASGWWHGCGRRHCGDGRVRWRHGCAREPQHRPTRSARPCAHGRRSAS
jgi:hypothetical protein